MHLKTQTQCIHLFLSDISVICFYWMASTIQTSNCV